MDSRQPWGDCIADPAGNKSGHITQDTCWCDTSTPYIINGTLYVDAGITLDICPDVEVQTNASYGNGYDFVIDGIVTVNGSQFTGTTEILVRIGGRLD